MPGIIKFYFFLSFFRFFFFFFFFCFFHFSSSFLRALSLDSGKRCSGLMSFRAQKGAFFFFLGDENRRSRAWDAPDTLMYASCCQRTTGRKKGREKSFKRREGDDTNNKERSAMRCDDMSPEMRRELLSQNIISGAGNSTKTGREGESKPVAFESGRQQRTK